MKNNFIHLRLQSSYSMLESSIKIENIASLARANSMPAVALTDRNNLFGCLEFALNAQKNGVQPIAGVILNLLYNGEYSEILLLAKDESGIQNLFKLASIIYTHNSRKEYEHITFDDLVENSSGLIALSAWTNGHIGKYIAANNLDAARELSKKLKDIFGDRFYFEISRHNLAIEKQIESSYISLANELDIALIATNQILFSNYDMHDAHDTLLCMSESVKKDEEKRRRVSNECYFKSPKEMCELFKDIPSACENSIHIAKRCSAMLNSREPMLPTFADDGNEEDLFRKLSYDGLLIRLSEHDDANRLKEKIIADPKYKEYFDRLEYELDIICRMKFPGYFLIVSDFIKWAKEQGIPVGPGRGSGAGSIVAWALLITDLDPLRFGLLFERFLNPERISMPDFDIDFCQERRMEVIEYVMNKYGNNRVGQIITFGKLQAKAVIKDVARALGLRYGTADRTSKLVPFNAVNPVTLSKAIDDVDELKQASLGKGLYNYDLDEEEKVLLKEVIETSLKLEGLHRHASIHAAGIVIAGQDLVELLPLYRDENSKMLVIQYSMKYAEQAGLVKFDFLGLKTLTTISKCTKLLKEQGVDIEVSSTEFNDSKTYEMLSTGASSGVFQFESPGMKDSLRKLKPDAVEDLIALGALYRPGPMDNIPTYIACKHGLKEPDYLHPLLKELLTETYGVIIYQEQVLKIAQILAGYSLGSADMLRRAMGKKVKAEMDAQRAQFIKGAEDNKISSKQAKEIFDLVAKFAGYGFNKAHASAYGVISYQTAYLKANYLHEFLVATLNLEIHDTDKILLFIQEAKNNNIKILSPDINSSSSMFAVVKLEDGSKAISFALGALKNLGIDSANEIVKLRTKFGEFKNIFDFIERAGKLVNKRILEHLIKAGGFDSIYSNRKMLLESIDIIMSHASDHENKKKTQQRSLFDLIEDMQYPELVDVQDFTKEERAFAACEGIGFFLDEHPLSIYEDLLQKQKIFTSIDIKEKLLEGSHNLNMVGIISSKDARMSARGKFVNLNLSDHKGIFEATIFNEDIFKEAGELLDVKSMIALNVDVRKDSEGGIRTTVISITSFFKFLESLELKSIIKLDDDKILGQLKKTHNVKGANTRVTLSLDIEEGFLAEIKLPGKFLVNND